MSVRSSHPPNAAVGTRESTRLLFNHIAEHCDLPPLPAAAARAIALARDLDTTTDDLARVVQSDAPLAARVLRISRSVTYLRRQPPRTLKEAIVTVGFQGLRKILITASARASYRADDDVAGTLWAHALATAFAADEITKSRGGLAGGDAFIAGLLHDIGKLVFHLADPDAFRRLAGSDLSLEEEVFGAGHAAVGACLAELWGLEDDLVMAIMFHHEGHEISPLAACVAHADGVATRIGHGSVPGPLPPAQTAEDDEESRALDERVRALFESERKLFD